MRRLTSTLALATVGIAGTAMLPAAAVAAGHRVYFNSDHHIYRASADRPSHRTSLPVPHRKHAIVDKVAISPNGKRLVEDITYLGLTKNAPATCIKHSICERWGIARPNGSHVRWIFTAADLKTATTGPVWGPDNKTIYYSVRFLQTGREGEQYLAKLKLGHHVTQRRVQGGAGLTQPSPSPDGKFLVAVRPTFNDQGFPTHSDLVTLKLSSGTVGDPLLSTDQPLGERVNAYQDPAWSPDGSTIALVIANPIAGPQDNERSTIDIVAADGSDNGTPTEAASGGQVYYEHAPAWRTSHQLWFSRNFASFGNSDNERHTGNADLFRVGVHGHSVSAPKRLTHTTKVDELNASFAWQR